MICLAFGFKRMEVLREQETGHSSEAGICRLSLPALQVSCISRPRRNQHFRTIRSKVIFLAPLNMVLIHRKQLSGCHTAASPTSPFPLPIHSPPPHFTPSLRPLSKQKHSSQAGVCVPIMPEQEALHKDTGFSFFLYLSNHFSSISSALV